MNQRPLRSTLLACLLALPAAAQAPDLIWMRGGQAGGSNHATWAPDGATFAIAGEDGTLKLFDAATHLLLETIQAHAPMPAQDVRYSPHGERLASIGDDNAVRVWDVPSGALLWEAQQGVWVLGLAFAHDGALLAHGMGSTVQVRDAATGALLQSLSHVGDVGSVAFSPDGLRLVASGGSSAEVLRSWRTSDWSHEHDFATTHEWADFAFTADGGMVATGGGFDFPSIRLWNPATGALLKNLPMGPSFGPAFGVGFSADEQTVFAGHRHNRVRAFDIATGAQVLHVPETPSIQLAPDGQTFLGQPIRCGEPRYRWARFAFPSGDLLEEFMTHTSAVTDLHVSADGAMVASGATFFDSAVRVWDTATAARLHELQYTCNNIGVACVAFSPDGALLAAGGGDWGQQIRIWRLSDGALLHELPQDASGTATAVLFSPDGSRLATGGSTGDVILWSMPGASPIQIVPTGEVRDLAFSPDGTTLAVATGLSGLHLLDVPSGAIALTIPAHGGVVHDVEITSDGARVVSGGGDGLIQVWSTSDGSLLATLDAADGLVRALDLSDDDAFLVSAHMGGLRLWDLAALALLATYTEEVLATTDVQFLPGGASFAYSRADATVAIAHNPAAGEPGVHPYCACAQGAPCGNPDAGAGCANSTGSGASLFASGSTSMAADDLMLTSSGMPSGVVGVLVMGSLQKTASPFGDGQLCIAGGASGIARFPAQMAGAQGSFATGPIVGLVNGSLPPAAHIAPGATRTFQTWYRDPQGPCGSATNLTDALAVTFGP